ncbi:cytochrome C [Desulfonema ishimotonii]|uniref:Cytochrome C n=1 Tax=Desulfonema ishimotonii TaxID=45657 RepID=A0A401G0E2_9BACT|nr:cytochrome c3 family protein [Desulfonema ishimotonii]GBC62702.1 cytochrome C [Desulfonema ishimotonii]
MKFRTVLPVVIGILMFAVVMAMAAGDKGAENISLYGGKSGEVPFPHQRHQATLGDCNTCHELFPQEAGSIERLKAAKELKKKQVMNKHCIRCHRAMKREGTRSGPTSCKECHVKK